MLSCCCLGDGRYMAQPVVPVLQDVLPLRFSSCFVNLTTPRYKSMVSMDQPLASSVLAQHSLVSPIGSVVTPAHPVDSRGAKLFRYSRPHIFRREDARLSKFDSVTFWPHQLFDVSVLPR